MMLFPLFCSFTFCDMWQVFTDHITFELKTSLSFYSVNIQSVWLIVEYPYYWHHHNNTFVSDSSRKPVTAGNKPFYLIYIHILIPMWGSKTKCSYLSICQKDHSIIYRTNQRERKKIVCNDAKFSKPHYDWFSKWTFHDMNQCKKASSVQRVN